ncbi:MAG: cytochrome c-type biogenesis protein CcmH [Gammaproteobacteria bacterium]|nr:cytochrome c-type biogenesis protein CcmH [Gammaproteobacteria bacterium]MCK5262319.1 cytochrome c-type biogenesis protein CcmH [Gammaproteobacteria bacterium]
MKTLFVIVAMFFYVGAWAAPMDTFEFESEAQEKTFRKLSDELRCLVCQNQSIADSNADLAKDLRTEIHGMLLAGKNEEQIKEFMVDRYGDYVLYEPPFNPMTWLLWFGPAMIFLIALFYVRRFILQQNSVKDSGELSAEEAERLKDLQLELNLPDQNNSSENGDMKGGSGS